MKYEIHKLCFHVNKCDVSYSALILRAVLMIFLVASMYPLSPMCIMVAQQAAMIPPGLEPATEGEA